MTPRREGRELVIARQRWDDLLFVHWRVAADDVARDLPSGVHVDVHDGSAWLSLVAFRARTRPAALPARWAFDHLEVNLRTYVQGRGIWLYAADVSAPLAQALYRFAIGRAAHRAALTHTRADDVVVYSGRRGYATLSLRADTADERAETPPPSLAAFLLDRDVQLSRRFGLLWSTRVTHAPLRAYGAGFDVVVDDWLRARRAPRHGAPVLAHTAQGVDVEVLAPRPIARARLRPPSPARLAT
jgi:uncharacterized protein YqjF (DUF2071 family)